MAKKKSQSTDKPKRTAGVKDRSFTSRQRLFIDFYLRCWNATRSAILAGYSPKTARQMGAENLSKPAISEEIEKRLKASKMTADKALYLLTQQAEGTLAHFYDHETSTFDLDSDEARANFHLLKKVKLTRKILPAGVEIQTIQLELEDKQNALIQIGRHYGVFVDKQEHKLDETQLALLTGREAVRRKLNDLKNRLAPRNNDPDRATS